MSENAYYIENFEDMPNLAERIRAFEEHLEAEPCTNKVTMPDSDGNAREIDGCQILSQTTAMCPACRLRMSFFHLTHNWDAYHRGEE